MVRRCRRGNRSLPPPSSKSQVEDEGGEREEEEDVSDGEGCEDVDAFSGPGAFVRKKKKGGVGGEVRKKKGEISRGRGVD